jgi:hypothetical protein
VRFARDRTERHRAGGETPHDGLGGLHVLERHKRAAVFLCILSLAAIRFNL